MIAGSVSTFWPFLRPRRWCRSACARYAAGAEVCSGALMLAEAGRLDGCEVASHWAYAAMFRRHYLWMWRQEGDALVRDAQMRLGQPVRICLTT